MTQSPAGQVSTLGIFLWLRDSFLSSDQSTTNMYSSDLAPNNLMSDLG